MVAVGMNLSSTFDAIAGSSKLRLPKRSASAAAVVAFVVAALFPPPPYRVLRGDRVSHASRRASETVPSRQVHPQPTGSSRRRSPRSDRSLLARDYKPSATRTYPNAGLALPAPASSGRILRAAGLITTLSEPQRRSRPRRRASRRRRIPGADRRYAATPPTITVGFKSLASNSTLADDPGDDACEPQGASRGQAADSTGAVSVPTPRPRRQIPAFAVAARKQLSTSAAIKASPRETPGAPGSRTSRRFVALAWRRANPRSAVQLAAPPTQRETELALQAKNPHLGKKPPAGGW